MSALTSATPSRELVTIGRVQDFPAPGLRLVHAAGQRLLVISTSEGVTVTDNACPHEGYGLVGGRLTGDTLTCEWHNWKFRAADGRCLRGEEDLRTYPVEVVDGELRVDLTGPPPAVTRQRLTESLRSGIEAGYNGQIARDVVRLLRADADPVQVVWEGVAWGAPRAEFGFGHALASLVDCLTVAAAGGEDARALPIVDGLVRVAEDGRRRPLRPQPDPLRHLPARPAQTFADALEAEDLPGAEALVRGALLAGAGPETLLLWLLDAVGRHHLSYGHGAIYVQKGFELCRLIGWDRADSVLPHLVPALGYATREDKLTYMRPFMAALAAVDLAALASTPGDGPSDGAGQLHRALLGRDARRVVAEAELYVRRGAGIEGLLDVVVAVASHRLLRYDPTAETTSDRIDFGWLDITHALTYASAARFAWRAHPGPGTARLALYTAWLAMYAGRRGYHETAPGDDPAGPGDDEPVPTDPTGLCRAALSARSGVPIISAHLVKTTRAAVVEAETTGSDLPLRAAARFVGAPRRESFVALNVRQAIRLADGHAPD